MESGVVGHDDCMIIFGTVNYSDSATLQSEQVDYWTKLFTKQSCFVSCSAHSSSQS